jgi:hypothetical protein
VVCSIQPFSFSYEEAKLFGGLTITASHPTWRVVMRTYADHSLADAFDIDYYLNKHIPLGRDAWSKYGLKKWAVVKLAPETGYSLQAIMTWESPQSVGRAMKEAGAEVVGDLENFSTEKPVVIQGLLAAGDLFE